ncbi:uncharacterized protein N7459_004724 [Penicillium hispanicum]|uniref:uncharacterized protein n=1 Tax=Penicillium hispanicum TaxID=1080232 RepID=UPI002541DA50|nr:uncharacterized protein N7459_004724 [Penicillium hispanicum]KAJ5584924.1 hypothetical protein N7459_004724 [Penicillium hispanicum]
MTDASLSWDHGTRSGLCSIGTHRLFLSAAGPSRQVINGSLQPAVIIEAGLGSGQREWVAVQRHIAQKARVYSYDRAGYGRSEDSPRPLTAENRVQELSSLLEAAAVEPPYVLVGHSYGGVLVREFLRQHGKERVAGMVIVDSARAVPSFPTDWHTLMGDSRYHSIIGLDQNYCVSPEEYNDIMQDDIRNEPTTEVESGFVHSSTDSVNAALPEDSQPLADHRLSVIFANFAADFQKVYDFGVAHGYGTRDAQHRLGLCLRDLARVQEQGQRAHLHLSSQSRFVSPGGKARTHNLQYVAPEVIRDEVFWVLHLH